MEKKNRRGRGEREIEKERETGKRQREKNNKDNKKEGRNKGEEGQEERKMKGREEGVGERLVRVKRRINEVKGRCDWIRSEELDGLESNGWRRGVWEERLTDGGGRNRY